MAKKDPYKGLDDRDQFASEFGPLVDSVVDLYNTHHNLTQEQIRDEWSKLVAQLSLGRVREKAGLPLIDKLVLAKKQ